MDVCLACMWAYIWRLVYGGCGLGDSRLGGREVEIETGVAVCE